MNQYLVEYKPSERATKIRYFNVRALTPAAAARKFLGIWGEKPIILNVFEKVSHDAWKEVS